MKNKIQNILILASVILTVNAIHACNFQANNSVELQQKDTTVKKSQTVTFTATDMGCSTDSKMVETALYRKKGVKKVKITGETIVVEFDPSKITIEEIKTTIENTGSCEDPKAKIHKVKIKTQ